MWCCCSEKPRERPSQRLTGQTADKPQRKCLAGSQEGKQENQRERLQGREPEMLSFVLSAGGEVEGRAKARRTMKEVGQGRTSYARSIYGSSPNKAANKSVGSLDVPVWSRGNAFSSIVETNVATSTLLTPSLLSCQALSCTQVPGWGREDVQSPCFLSSLPSVPIPSLCLSPCLFSLCLSLSSLCLYFSPPTFFLSPP